MRTPLIFLTTLLTLTNCDYKTDNKTVSIKERLVDCTPYFIYDQIDHYTTEIDEPEVWDIQAKTKISEKEKRQLALLTWETPKSLSDTVALKDIEDLDFKKIEIHSNKFKQINDIFCERKHKNSVSTTCIPIYRDILVFKKDNKTMGVAKICFSCNQSQIIGTELNSEDFGQSGDYEKLSKLLH